MFCVFFQQKLDAVPTATQLLDTVHSKSVVETEISLDDCEEQDKRMHQAAIASTILATSVVKQASVLAFQQYKRSMTAPNVLEKLGEAFSFCEES